MGTTTNALPYPEPTDDLRDGAEAIEDLADGLDVQGTVAALVAVPMASGVTGFITAFRIGGLVVLDVDASTSFPDATSTTITGGDGVPVGLRPSATRFGVCYTTSGFIGMVYVQSSGSMSVTHHAGSARANARGLIIYPAPAIGG